MSVAELTLAITLGIVFSKAIIDLIGFIVEYPMRKRRNKLMRELVSDMKDLTDKMVADMNRQKTTKTRQYNKNIKVNKDGTISPRNPKKPSKVTTMKGKK